MVWMEKLILNFWELIIVPFPLNCTNDVVYYFDYFSQDLIIAIWFLITLGPMTFDSEYIKALCRMVAKLSFQIVCQDQWFNFFFRRRYQVKNSGCIKMAESKFIFTWLLCHHCLSKITIVTSSSRSAHPFFIQILNLKFHYGRQRIPVFHHIV